MTKGGLSAADMKAEVRGVRTPIVSGGRATGTGDCRESNGEGRDVRTLTREALVDQAVVHRVQV
jgi:hypothetical protein